jgi:hypothetical protein
MTIDWGALGAVFAVALGSVAVLTTLFAFGVRELSERVTVKETGGTGTVPAAIATACFAVCAAIVLFGIYLIIA